MRYEFVGRKVPYVGKTLWEIVGNLKNFGVGRLVKKNTTESYPELSFFKIIKVQPIPPPKNEFYNRNVMVWIEEVFRDRKLEIKTTLRFNNLTEFQLISKEEEQEYLERLQKLERPIMYLKKYCNWPPLYKKLWEKKTTGKDEDYGPIPKLKSAIPHEPGVTVIEKEEEIEKSTCSLYKGELSVEEMYKEIVRLKLLIKANSNA